MKKCFLLVPFMIFIIMGCKDNSTNPTNTSVIMPLNIGNTWIYKITEYDTLGNVRQTTYDTMSVINDTLINSEIFFNIYHTINNGKVNHTNRTDGLYSFNSFIDGGNQYILDFKYPAQVGDRYNYIRHVDSLNATVQTHVGIFLCYKYTDREEPTDESSAYYAPNIGFIMAESYQNHYLDGNWHKINQKELISYTLK